ncbi:MAG: hypothetical protein WBH51_15815 [Mycolicibacter algericus]
MSSSAAEVYSALCDAHAPAVASNVPDPGPLLNKAECTSGGDAIHNGALIAPHRSSTPGLYWVNHRSPPAASSSPELRSTRVTTPGPAAGERHPTTIAR